MTAPGYWQQATRELSERDAVIRRIAGKSLGLTLRSRGDAFSTLARSIVGQQISVKAAESVWRKFAAAVPEIRPEVIHAHDGEALRACGLSRSKVLYLQDLARHFIEGRLEVGRWKRMSDDELIAELTQVRGIGRWTAEMFLIFYMTRPDVLPVDDIGLQRAMSLHYNRGKPLTKLKMNSIAKRWLPWRSVATWYMWRSLDPVPVEY
ncbi:MAG: DNA-3-methyladenine glycosylase 2 family protein [Betaproteobacteria bacterium]|nr:DNA-3-methyladenine glycosylase 2 family protein [Betaproteobacteria bacterium]MBI3055868.1 DNA-3-methyladenine glycosylase 2 family protein [Betaproteobacteria bacterium]